MRYLVTMSGVMGFSIVLGCSLWAGRPLTTGLLGALISALGFALLSQWWTILLSASYKQAVAEQATRAPTSAQVEREEPDPAKMPPMENNVS